MQQVGLAVPQYLLSFYSSSIVKIFYNYGLWNGCKSLAWRSFNGAISVILYCSVGRRWWLTALSTMAIVETTEYSSHRRAAIRMKKTQSISDERSSTKSYEQNSRQLTTTSGKLVIFRNWQIVVNTFTSVAHKQLLNNCEFYFDLLVLYHKYMYYTDVFSKPRQKSYLGDLVND